jgi:hypothetical protein
VTSSRLSELIAFLILEPTEYQSFAKEDTTDALYFGVILILFGAGAISKDELAPIIRFLKIFFIICTLWRDILMGNIHMLATMSTYIGAHGGSVKKFYELPSGLVASVAFDLLWQIQWNGPITH